MFPDITDSGVLPLTELRAVYDISQAVARSEDIESTLKEITARSRPVFIFDNMVLYTVHATEDLEPSYARAIGRGRSREANLVWGEMIASEALHLGHNVIREEKLAEHNQDRINLRYYLGIPLRLGGQIIGVLVFIRFGGPEFSAEQINLAEYIAVNVALLLEHQELVERIASLEAKRRLDELQDGFIAMVSHELLTPLGFIKGYATTLLRPDINWDKDTRQEFLTIIDEETDRLRELIESLLDSSRLQAGTLQMDFQPVRLDTFMNDVVLRAATRYENLSVNLDMQTSGLQIQADPTRLIQVFENLISNAVKYAPGSPILIGLKKADEMAIISISDRGPGIADEHVVNLFKRFYRVPTTSSVARGTGLGLYICRQIVQAHHGDIKVESTLGQGTTFSIMLPC